MGFFGSILGGLEGIGRGIVSGFSSGVHKIVSLPGKLAHQAKQTALHTFETMFLKVIGMLLDYFLGILSAIFNIIMSIIDGAIGLIVNTAISLGPFGLPVLTIGTVTIIGGIYTIFHILKDTPVVGGFV